MATYWGVDSSVSAHKPVPGVTGTATLYDYLVTNKRVTPTFFGRYLKGGTTNLTVAEADYLLERNCKILPVFRNGNPAGKDGATFATLAIGAANAVGVGNNVVIYVDIEPLEKPTVAFIKGWATTMYRSRFGGAGGFYCNNWVGSDFMKAFKVAYNELDPVTRTYIYLWCQIPQNNGCQVKASFTPNPVDIHPSGPRVWQYGLDCFKIPGHKYGLVDMNTANHLGYAGMWG